MGLTKKHKKASVRKELLIEGVLQGKTPPKAAKAAGYSDSYSRVNVYRELAKASTQERIRERLQEAQVDTNEIIGTLVSHMRGDLADVIPDEEILKSAKERGVSHLIKELKVTRRTIPADVDEEGEETFPEVLETKYEIKLHDAQAAAKQLCNVFELEHMPAPNSKVLDDAIDRLIAKAEAKGLEVTPEQARAKLMPFIKTQTVQ